MKQLIFLFMLLFLYSCNYKNAEVESTSIINADTLFERKVPILLVDMKLQVELDSLVEKEVDCYYYKKDTTCFGVWAKIWEKDTLLGISTANCYDFDFSTRGRKKTDTVYGYFKYKNFVFFCYTSVMSI